MRGERPFIYHTPNGREMFQPLQKILPALRTGAVNRAVGDAVLQWSAAEQMPLGSMSRKKGSTLAGASLIYTQCFSRLSQRLLSHVPRLWNSCTSRIRMTTATSITRYLYR